MTTSVPAVDICAILDSLFIIQMAKKLSLYVALVFFALSVSLGTGEQLLSHFEVESQSSLSVDQEDLSPGADYISGLLSRILRAKSSIKALPSLHAPTQEISLVGWINDPSFSPPFSKSSVYQQISVYRL